MNLHALAAMVLLFASTASAELMIPDSGNDRVMLFSETDGSLVDANWITDIGAVGWQFSTPKEARVVGNEIWVSDQVADAIHRFDMSRNFLSSITVHPGGGLLDNLRGFGADADHVYLAVFPSSTALRGIAVFDTAGNPLNFFPISASLFDAEPYHGELLVANNTSDDMERRDATTGALNGVFASDVEALQFVNVLADDSIITASTIAPAGVEGIYHFNADGTLRLYIDTEAAKIQFGEMVPRAAWLLDDGDYLIATGDGVLKYSVDTGGFTFILACDAQFIAPISLGTACDIPGDINGDQLVNGEDLQGFTACLLGLDGGDCDCADVNDSGLGDLNDVAAFVALLVGN